MPVVMQGLFLRLSPYGESSPWSFCPSFFCTRIFKGRLRWIGHAFWVQMCAKAYWCFDSPVLQLFKQQQFSTSEGFFWLFVLW